MGYLLTHEEIREKFLKFFESKGHRVLPSFSLIPENDPSLLFVAAGMVPFKAEFSGKVEPKYRRITTCQKCFRMDDIENVGYTLRHHTFFEMLGNFSFGDYFKKESIYWAYELLTEVYKIDPAKLYYSCHPQDDEAEKIWLSLSIPSEKIVRLEDNFWGPAGITGPCGPSTEIFYENFPCNQPSCKPGFECEECQRKERFIEIWNIVFTEYFKDSDGKLFPLPQKNIDTGMGLERLTRILQNKNNQYETDLFLPLIQYIRQNIDKDVEKVYSEMKIKYDPNEYNQKKEIYERIVADHIRGANFLLADGVVPSNEGRGYVLRKLIRRGLLYSKLLGISKNFLKNTTEIVASIFEKVYPEINQRKDYVQKMLEIEENSFNRNVYRGMEYISKIDINKITGKDAFYLYDTLGFPIELTIEISKSKNFQIDLDEFYKELEIQRQRSRQKETDIKIFSVNQKYETKFVGYDNLVYQSKIIGILKNTGNGLEMVEYIDKPGEEVILILSETPFYPESGGQVGDKGIIYNQNFVFEVYDTQKHVEEFIFHIGKLKEGVIQVNHEAWLEVNQQRRKELAINHTCTHLLHSALRKIIGHHVYQAGSLVDQDKLRFDFTHFENLTSEQIDQIEELVNEKIYENLPVLVEYKPLSIALEEGAIALFAEKYPDTVRTVKIGDFSYELCGGTHLDQTSKIGIFKIKECSSIQMGVKRIEAITSKKVAQYLSELTNLLANLKDITKQEEKNIINYIQKMQAQIKELNKKNKQIKTKLFHKIVEEKIRNQTNQIMEFEVEDEEEIMMIHDIIKTKMNYVALYKTPYKNILVYHKDMQIPINLPDQTKKIPMGNYFKVFL
ncbi:MAG: alanine--tRNA ligase [bacterium]